MAAEASDDRGDAVGGVDDDGSDDTGAGSAALPAWDDLPGPVRYRLIAMAATAIGEVPAARLPALVAPVARFTARHRARRGATPLARTLASDGGFRALVAQHTPVRGALDGDDPIAAAAAAFLLRLPQAAAWAQQVAEDTQIVQLRRQVDDLTDTVDRLTRRLTELTDGDDTDTARRDDTGESAKDATIADLRQRLRERGSRARQEADRAAAELRQAQRERDAAVAARQRSEDHLRTLQDRVDQLQEQARLAREGAVRVADADRQAQADRDRRIELLLETVERAAAGLRRELRLQPGGAEPVEAVAVGLTSPSPIARRSVDDMLLLTWLRLPHAHLIVDGYNVTKTGYPQLSLADQRERLIRQLRALASRTGAQITVVFDGAAVVAPTGSTGSVRVLFSPAGVIADDVIRDLVAIEPTGRVVVVASSDREIVTAVRGQGHRTTPSDVLLEVLP